MPPQTPAGINAVDIETAQSLGKLPCNFLDCHVASPVVGVEQAIEQGRGGGRERNLGTHGENIFVESDR